MQQLILRTSEESLALNMAACTCCQASRRNTLALDKLHQYRVPIAAVPRLALRLVLLYVVSATVACLAWVVSRGLPPWESYIRTFLGDGTA